MKQVRVLLNREIDLAELEAMSCENYLPELVIDPAVADWQQLKSLNCDKLKRVVIPMEAVTKILFKYYHSIEDNILWDSYWETIEEAVKIVGPGKVFVVLFAGMSETEQQFAQTCQRICELGAEPTLLCLATDSIPGKETSSIGRYRRMQMIRYLISMEISDADTMQFNEFGSICEFGVPKKRLMRIMQEASPFFTVGTGDINPASYEWPGHDNECLSRRNWAPDMSEEQKKQVRGEFSWVNWEEEWSSIGSMIKSSDIDLNELMEDEDDIPPLSVSSADLRYLNKN